MSIPAGGNQDLSWVRNNIRSMLETLASEEDQLEYERKVPHVDITSELVCMWFDDYYHPDLPAWCACFSREELERLAEFNHFYEQRERQLPASEGTVRTWLASPLWREIMKKAAETLAQIRP